MKAYKQTLIQAIVMFHVQPKARRYLGQIVLEDQPITWISKHRGIADRAWLLSAVKYGEWIKDRNKKGCFSIYATNVASIRNIKVLIKIRKFTSHVSVYHVHLLR